MKYLSICSGIEAATVAWHGFGWEPVAFAEIEPFPAAVLAHHYPEVPNLGDMTKFKEWQVDAFDVLVGGTPCQAFSVAGLRQSLDDARGNLSLVFCEMADRFDPPYILWENVPGVLNTKDNAFGCFLAGLAGEDVPLVAPGGKWTNAGFVLGPKRNVAWRVLDAQYFGLAQRRRRVFVVACPRNGADPCEILFEREGVQRHSAPSREKGEGFAAVAGTLSANRGGLDRPAGNANELDFCVPSVMAHGQGNAEIVSDGSPSLTCNHEVPIAFAQNQLGEVRTGGIANTLNTNFNASDRNTPCVAFAQNQRAEVTLNDTAGSLKVGGGKPGQGYPAVMTPAMQVRRLVPVECERLQGFPDNYTAIPWRNKSAEDCPDGPRYKALGNSMAVPCMRWIGWRIGLTKRNP